VHFDELYMLECAEWVLVYIAFLAWLGNFPMIFMHWNFDLQWLMTKPGGMCFNEAYPVSLEM